MTPEEAWSGNKPDVSHLKIFGCHAFMPVPKEHRDKLGSQSLLCTFLGYAHNYSTYCLVHRSTHRFFESRDVIFDELGHPHERTIIDPGVQTGDAKQIIRPKWTTCTPIKDDDPHYEVTSYGQRQVHTNLAKLNESNNTR